MDLHPTPDQAQLVEAIAGYLESKLPAARLPQTTPEGVAADLWRELAAMGWLTGSLAEADGGSGLTIVEEALVMQEFGRQAAPPSILATVVAIHVAAELGDRALTAALARGERRACFGLPDPLGGRLRLLDTAQSDLVTIWSGEGLWLAESADCANPEPVSCIDASITSLAADPPRRSHIASEAAGRKANLLSAAWLTGGAEASCALAVEYAGARQQFGKPIGAFQAIAHKCARMAIGCEEARALMQFAAVCQRDNRSDAAFHVSAARIVAATVAYDNAVDTMQVFGGYGQAYEYLPHFYLKQALLIGALGGGGEANFSEIMKTQSTL